MVSVDLPRKLVALFEIAFEYLLILAKLEDDATECTTAIAELSVSL